MKKLLIIYCIIVLFSGCLSKKITVSWKADHISGPVPDRMVVVGIIKADNDSLRTEIEDGLVKYLTDLGYSAVSALKEFGTKGLSDLSQEETYLKLCNRNIDVVMTIALIDKLKQEKFSKSHSPASISYYYYNTIWNYKKMQADLSAEALDANTRYMWECILFDLNTLEPLCVVQTRSFKPGNENKSFYLTRILDKLKREKILYQQKSRSLKPF